MQRNTTEIAIDTFHNGQVLVTFIFFLDSLCFWRLLRRLVLFKLFSQYSRIEHIEVMEFSTDPSVMGCTWDTCLIYSRVLILHRQNDTVIYQLIPKHHPKTPNTNIWGLSRILLPTHLPIFSLGTLCSLGFFCFFCFCATFFLISG